MLTANDYILLFRIYTGEVRKGSMCPNNYSGKYNIEILGLISRDAHTCEFSILPKGKFLVEHIKSLSLPVQVEEWRMP